MKLNFRNRILAAVFFACAVCTGVAILVSMKRIESSGHAALVEKSRAILSRVEAGAKYVADMDTLDDVVAEAKAKYPDGKLPDEQKLKVLKSVPVFAAFKLGANEAAKDNYRFRVSALTPRLNDNLATEAERVVLQKFQADTELKEWVEESTDGKYLLVSRPVRISEERGCMTCHGHPSKSPWGNGKDILGYQMEDLKNGELRGMFTIVSDLGPVEAATHDANFTIILWALSASVIALLLAFAIVRLPISELSRVSHDLDLSAKELNAASQQISSVSESLSTNSTQSASALEETAASVEELTSMVTLNAKNAEQAAKLSAESSTEAVEGENEMKKLAQSMSEISKSSSQIKDIINVIDDIAFQTNLLALNAAVEAARAGEQGKGFAVVAEAVRNLASRSASAAKDIAGLIEDSVAKIERGSKAADATGEVLQRIVSSVKEISELNRAIASASQEQAHGFNQITKAMEELNSSTQSNAAASEEASSSSDTMHQQSESLRTLVVDLITVVDGVTPDSAHTDVTELGAKRSQAVESKTKKKAA